MKNLIVFLPFLILIAACDSGKHNAVLNDANDSISYVIGEALFRSFDNKGLYLNPTKVREGYVATRDSTTYMKFGETQAYIQKLEFELEKRQEAFTSKEQPNINLDTIAYAMGADLGHRFNTLSIAINPDALYQGISDYAQKGAKGSQLPGNTYETQYAKYEAWVKDAAMFKRAELAQKNEIAGLAYLGAMAKEEGVVALESELLYKELKAGTGPVPRAGDSVIVQYIGRFPNGKVFDETKGDETAGFLLKENMILQGWLEALTRMPQGARWELYVPSKLAYGARGFYDIEPNKALEFEVELIKVLRAK